MLARSANSVVKPKKSRWRVSWLEIVVCLAVTGVTLWFLMPILRDDGNAASRDYPLPGPVKHPAGFSIERYDEWSAFVHVATREEPHHRITMLPSGRARYAPILRVEMRDAVPDVSLTPIVFQDQPALLQFEPSRSKFDVTTVWCEREGQWFALSWSVREDPFASAPPQPYLPPDVERCFETFRFQPSSVRTPATQNARLILRGYN